MPDAKRPITAEDLNRIHYLRDPQISPDGCYVAFVKVSPDPLEKTYKQNIWLLPLDHGEAIQLTRGDKDGQPLLVTRRESSSPSFPAAVTKLRYFCCR